MTGECFLYRIYDEGGGLLYVGCSMDPDRRIRAHLRLQPWADQVAHHTVSGPFLTDDAVRLEREAIRNETPRHNVAAYPPERMSA